MRQDSLWRPTRLEIDGFHGQVDEKAGKSWATFDKLRRDFGERFPSGSQSVNSNDQRVALVKLTDYTHFYFLFVNGSKFVQK